MQQLSKFFRKEKDARATISTEKTRRKHFHEERINKVVKKRKTLLKR